MNPVRILMSVATPRMIVELADGTYRWWIDSGRIDKTGPAIEWVKRGLTAHSVTWNGPAIQEMPLSDFVLRSFGFLK